jgi:segregation and condensation protein A
VTIVNTLADDAAGLLSYQLRLPSFEGPYDVLLRLVERSQLNITDVSLVEVTSQFLAHIAGMRRVDPEVVAEFSTVGSRLIVLKSRSLLPRPAITIDEPISDLAQELIEYKAFRDMADLLGRRDSIGRAAFPIVAPPLPEMPTAELPLGNHQPAQLLRAIRRRLHTVQPSTPIVVARRIVSLREMAERLLSHLRATKEATFRAVSGQCADYHEVRTAFLAVLVLARRNVIDVEQSQLFGDITIRSVPSGDNQDSFLAGLSFDERGAG